MILLVGSNSSDIFLYYGPVSSLPLPELRGCIPFPKSEFSHPLTNNFCNPDFLLCVLLGMEGRQFVLLHANDIYNNVLKSETWNASLGLLRQSAALHGAFVLLMKVEVGLGIESVSSFQAPRSTAVLWLLWVTQQKCDPGCARGIILGDGAISIRLPGETDIPCHQGARGSEWVYPRMLAFFGGLSAFPELSVSRLECKYTLSIQGHIRNADSSCMAFFPSAIAVERNMIIKVPVVQFNLTECSLRVCCSGIS